MNSFKYFQFASPFQGERLITTAKNVDNYWDESHGDNAGRSWQFFDDSLNHYCKYNGSPSGYQGKSDSPIIPIDIDNSSTENLIMILDKLGELLGDLEDVNLYYSGRKGYHIEIPSCMFALQPSDNLPERMKRMVSKFNIDADLSLYKQSQLYRMNNSLNVSGGHYKTQIDVDDVIVGMNLNEIKSLAVKPNSQSFEMFDPIPIKERDWLIDLWEQTECADNTKIKVSGGVYEGLRNVNAYNTALSLKTQGIRIEDAYEIVEQQNKKNVPPEPNLKELLVSVDSAYNGKFFMKFPINPVLQHLKDFEYWHSLNNRRKTIYVQMLCEANVRENIWQGVRIKRNQFVYGKITTAEKWNIPFETLRKDLDKFEKDSIIKKDVYKHGGKYIFTIITLLSFDVTHNYTHTLNEEKKE